MAFVPSSVHYKGGAYAAIFPKPLTSVMTTPHQADSDPMPKKAMISRTKKLLYFQKTLGIKASLVGAVLVTVTITAAIVYVPWAIASKRNLKTMVAKNNEEIVVGASQGFQHVLLDGSH